VRGRKRRPNLFSTLANSFPTAAAAGGGRRRRNKKKGFFFS